MRADGVSSLALSPSLALSLWTGKYFSQYLQDQIEKKALGGASEVRNILEEVCHAYTAHT